MSDDGGLINSMSSIDWFEHRQKPDLPTTSDPLARFVISRIIELETEPRNEIKPLYDQPGGAMAHRYAKHVRADCVVFRHIVLLYLEAVAEDEVETGTEEGWITRGQRETARAAVLAVANRWSDHREFDENWRRT